MKFKKGWSAEVKWLYRSQGIEGQIIIDPLWRLDAGLQKEILKNKGTLKLGIRDIFATQNFSGNIKYMEIDVFVKTTSTAETHRLLSLTGLGSPCKIRNVEKQVALPTNRTG